MANVSDPDTEENDKLFTSQWLTENKLQPLSSIFVENGITREDLIGLSANTCDALAFCQDYGIRHVVKNRFIQALHKIALKKETPKNDTEIASQLTQMDLSTEERELMNKIDQQKRKSQARMDKIDHLIKNIVNQQTLCLKEINDTYDALIQSLNDRRIILQNEVELIYSEKKNKLHSLRQNIETNTEKITVFQTECHQLASDPQTDTSHRKQRILQNGNNLLINCHYNFLNEHIPIRLSIELESEHSNNLETTDGHNAVITAISGAMTVSPQQIHSANHATVSFVSNSPNEIQASALDETEENKQPNEESNTLNNNASDSFSFDTTYLKNVSRKKESFVDDDPFIFNNSKFDTEIIDWTNTFKQTDENNNIFTIKEEQKNNNNNFVDWSPSFGGFGFSAIKVTEGFTDAKWGNNDIGGFGAFANSAEFSINALQQKETTNNKETANEDVNYLQTAFKPIVQLEETKVATGHEDETLIAKVPFLKLYRFGKDVTQEPCWKTRACESSVYFYKSNTNGKIRIIGRENETNKLRMNQFVPKSYDAAFELGQNKVYQWKAYDSSIAAEEQKDSAGFTLWCIRFENTDYAEKFAKEFKEAMKINDSLADNNAQKSTQIVDKIKQEQDTNAITQNEAQLIQNNEEQYKYKGWKEEDLQKVANSLSSNSGESENQVSGWEMPEDLFSYNASTTDNNIPSDYDSDDLEAEKVSNQIQPNASILFGANDAKISDNSDNNTMDDSTQPQSIIETLICDNYKWVNIVDKTTTNASDENKSEQDTNAIVQNEIELHNNVNEDEKDEERYSKAVITDTVDASVEKQIFQHRPVRVWRWDKDQAKWRGRGKGPITLYFHQDNVGKIVFVDEKHDKTRLLQYIDGETYCEFSGETKTEIEWFGADYTMDAVTPMVGKWKILFYNMESDGEAAAQQFMDYFNVYIDGNRAEIGDQHKQEVNTKEITQNNVNDDENDEKRYKECVDKAQDTQFVEFIIKCANIDNETHQNESDKSTKKVDHDSDHKLLEEFEILKLDRWRKDVSGAACWKIRASDTSLQYYQDNDAGKIKIVCMENITNELRLNQFIAAPKEAYLLKKTAKEVQWAGCDASIEEEDQEDKKVCLWIAKFADEETAIKFHAFFQAASESNATLTSVHSDK